MMSLSYSTKHRHLLRTEGSIYIDLIEPFAHSI
jgi:hypothetical protein